MCQIRDDFLFFFCVFSLQLAFSFPMVLVIDTCSGGHDPCTSLSEVSRPPFLNTFVDKPLVCGIQEWIACRTSRAACFPPLFLQGCSRNCNSICMPFCSHTPVIGFNKRSSGCSLASQPQCPYHRNESKTWKDSDEVY